MPCSNCSDQNAVITIQGIQVVNQNCCDPCSNCSTGSLVNANCVLYTGPALPCSTIATNTSLEDILIAFDTKLCAVQADYSLYNTFCLAPIGTQQEFVEGISEYVCTTRTDLDAFINDTFPAYQSDINDRFIAVEIPGTVCATAGVLSTDTLQTVLSKYCTKFGLIDGLLDVSGANWNQCFTVSPTPTTPEEGFDVLIDQICQLNTAIGGGVSLPTFNNVGSCLPTPLTITDTLVSTVNKIKTRLCQTGTFDINALTWTCVTKPSSTTTNLQAAFQAVLTKLDVLSQNFPTFSGDFDVTPINIGQPCLGKNIALSSSPYADKYVASTSIDTSPGTLEDKLLEGANIGLDYLTTPGKVIISSTGGSSSDEKVKSDVTDPTAGFLIAKVEPDPTPSSGISITINLNTTAHKVTIGSNVDMEAFAAALMTVVADNPTLYSQWCALNAGCPSPCAAPSNISVTYISGTTSTTTTTTTTL